MLLIGWLFYKFTPKKINDFMGYRTYRSMKSQEAWDYANKTSAKGLIYVGVATTIVQIIAIILMPEPFPILCATSFMVSALFIVIVRVEKQLKKLFPDE